MNWLTWWNQCGPRERRFWAEAAGTSDPEACFAAYRSAPPVARAQAEAEAFRDQMEAAERLMSREGRG